MSRLLVWILDNPLVSGLAAAILALGLYAGYQNLRITHLEAQNATLKANELTRQAQAKEAFRKNELIESANAAKTKKAINDLKQAAKVRDTLYADNMRLAADIERMRNSPDSGRLPEAVGDPRRVEGAATATSTRSCESAIAELAKEHDRLRDRYLQFQALTK